MPDEASPPVSEILKPILIGSCACTPNETNSAASATNAAARRSDVLAAIPGQFDLIVANPPYLVDKQARLYRNGGGMFGYDLSLRILRESLEVEGQALALYKELLTLVEGRSVMLEEYARQMIHAEELHAGEVDKMLRRPGEVAAFRTDAAQPG